MKATFQIDSPNILAEARPGDLFVPLGPDLVECVCAVRCHAVEHAQGSHVAWPQDASFSIDSQFDVVVVACRVGKGEPEYFPSGHTVPMPAATPVAFMEQVEALSLRPRVADAGLTALSLDDIRSALALSPSPFNFALSDVSRPELASRL